MWAAGRTDSGGVPLSYTAVFEPDPEHRSVVAGVVLIRAHGTAAHLMYGTQEPAGASAPSGAQVPEADVPTLVAVFNSGFKAKDFDGGYYRNGAPVRPLLNGQASAVIDDLATWRWGSGAAISR